MSKLGERTRSFPNLKSFQQQQQKKKIEMRLFLVRESDHFIRFQDPRSHPRRHGQPPSSRRVHPRARLRSLARRSSCPVSRHGQLHLQNHRDFDRAICREHNPIQGSLSSEKHCSHSKVSKNNASIKLVP